jgi:hypothetical protein
MNVMPLCYIGFPAHTEKSCKRDCHYSISGYRSDELWTRRILQSSVSEPVELVPLMALDGRLVGREISKIRVIINSAAQNSPLQKLSCILSRRLSLMLHHSRVSLIELQLKGSVF